MGRSSSEGTTMRSTTPSAGDSTSVITLSVSMTTRGSPLAIGSPSCFNHSMILPFSIVCPRLGIPNVMAMAPLPLPDEFPHRRHQVLSFGDHELFEFGTKGHRHIGGRYALHRRIEGI